MTTTPPVTFDFATWIALYPEFTNVSPGMGQNYFTRATFLCGDQTCNPTFCVPNMLSTLLYLLTSHIAWLSAPRDASGVPAATGAPPPGIAGLINSATEGSVSVGSDVGDINAGSPSQAWYMSTAYGREYWAMTAAVRTARYVPTPFLSPAAFPGAYWGRRGGLY